MLKKLIVTALAVAVMAVLMTSPAEAGGPQYRSGSSYNYHWTVQILKTLQFRFAYMFGVAPADPPSDGWGPGDGTGNDGDGPEDGTGYGPGPERCYQKYGECIRNGYGSPYTYRPGGQ